MVREFELEIMKYILRDPAGVNILEVVPDTFMKDPEMALFLYVVKTYYEEYGTVPHKANTLQYINDVEGISEDVQQVILPLVEVTFEDDFDVDREHLKHKITQEVQIYKTKTMISKFMDEDKPNFEGMFMEMQNILDIGNQMFEVSSARFALKDFTGFKHISYENVVRTPFRGMNDMLSAKGLFPPQILVIMAPAKGFKTGTMINFATHCVLQGKKVFYADFENGVDDIINRIYCRLTQANYLEMRDQITEETLKEVVKFSSVTGGDIYVSDYEMFTGTPGQVRADIEKLIANNWRPDVVIWDYADISSPTLQEHRRKPKHEQIQAVYGEIKNINKDYGVLSITASQMNRESMKNQVGDATALAGDIGKAANADMIWAMMQTDEEAKKGVGRFHPVLQRTGVRFTGEEFVYLRLDPERQFMEEIDEVDWLNSVDIEIEDDLEDI
ncbi:MAG TPA: DnaB family ATPase [Tissierellaceae bacterium]|nr:DnaB family ATPase [Tissierellaceae bacterium]